MRRRWYTGIYLLLYPLFRLVHPSLAVGVEGLPEGGALLCPNHTKASDPFLVVFALGLGRPVSAMAKAEIMAVPVVGWLLERAGVFGIDRGRADVGAVKTAMKRLKAGEKLLLFPEGTRVKEGEESSEAKHGAILLALSTGVPIVPVYVPRRKNWFRPTRVVFGEAYHPVIAGRRATAEEYDQLARELMERIWALAGEKRA